MTDYRDRYNKKVYKQFTIKFRKDEDAEIIKCLEENSKEGKSKRQWIHDLYYFTPEMPKDLCSIAEVEHLMTVFRVPRMTRINIVEALKKQCKKE